VIATGTTEARPDSLFLRVKGFRVVYSPFRSLRGASPVELIRISQNAGDVIRLRVLGRSSNDLCGMGQFVKAYSVNVGKPKPERSSA